MDSHTHKTPRRRKKRRFRPLRRILLILIILSMVYGVFSLGDTAVRAVFAPRITYQKAVLAEDPLFKGKAVVLRDEVVIAAPRSGVLNLLEEQGATVRASQSIFELVDKALLASIDKQLAEEATKITGKTSETDDAIAHKRVQLADAQTALRALSTAYAHNLRLGNSAEVSKLFSELERAQKTADKLAQEYEFAARSQAQYDTRRTELLAQRSQAILTITAPVSGQLTYRVDGHENTLRASEYRNVSLATLRQLTSNTKNQKNSETINAGQAVCSIVDPNNVVLLIESKSQGTLPAAIEIVFKDNVLAAETLAQVPTSEDNVTILALKIARPPATLIENRVAEFTVRARGDILCTIPAKAVMDDGRTTFVYVKDSSGAIEERLVVVRSSKGKNVVVTGLNPDEMVVANPKNLRQERSPN